MEVGFSSSEMLLSRSSDVEYFFQDLPQNAGLMPLTQVLLKSYLILYHDQTLYLDFEKNLLEVRSVVV